jgi:hypothetical protein
VIGVRIARAINLETGAMPWTLEVNELWVEFIDGDRVRTELLYGGWRAIGEYEREANARTAAIRHALLLVDTGAEVELHVGSGGGYAIRRLDR